MYDYTTRRKGKRLGRKPLPPVDIRKVIDAHLKDPKLSVRELAKKTGLPKSTVQKTLSNFRDGKVSEGGVFSG